MSTQLSNLVALNSTSTTPANKCKSSIFELICYKKLPQNQPSRMSLLEFRQWEYRGEGNEYLAISLPEQRKILRLRKSPCPNGLVENVEDWYSQNLKTDLAEEAEAAKFEKLNLEYYKILALLIGESYVQPSEEILLFRDEIFKINTIIDPKRPDYRKIKKIAYACGSLLTDYAYLPSDWEISQFNGSTFAVEIKPKQGWIPLSERTYHLCTYCLNQYIKLQNGETSGISEYCPMDLFSGQQSRMKLAIKNLLNSPQNNIKIFKEGVLVFGENVENKYENILSDIFAMATKKSVDEFCDLVTTALLKQLYTVDVHECSSYSHEIKNAPTKNHASVSTKACNLSRSKLPGGCVLDRILNLQELDVWGSQNIAQYLNQQNTENIYDHAVNVIARARNKNRCLNCVQCFFHEKYEKNNADLMIQQYLMSAVAKDCSLMLTFRKLEDNEKVTIPKEHIIRTASEFYAFNIGVFDLYPKPLTCIFKHVRKRSKFSQIYKNITNGNEDYVQSCNL